MSPFEYPCRSMDNIFSCSIVTVVPYRTVRLYKQCLVLCPLVHFEYRTKLLLISRSTSFFSKKNALVLFLLHQSTQTIFISCYLFAYKLQLPPCPNPTSGGIIVNATFVCECKYSRKAPNKSNQALDSSSQRAWATVYSKPSEDAGTFR